MGKRDAQVQILVGAACTGGKYDWAGHHGLAINHMAGGDSRADHLLAILRGGGEGRLFWRFVEAKRRT